MIVVTGSNGFIGSCLVSKLNQEGFKDIVLVDTLNAPAKANNLIGKNYTARIDSCFLSGLMKTTVLFSLFFILERKRIPPFLMWMFLIT